MTPKSEIIDSPMRLLRHLAQSEPQTFDDLLGLSPTQHDADELLKSFLVVISRRGWVVTLPPRQRVEAVRYAASAEGVLAAVRHLRRTERRRVRPSGTAAGRLTGRREGGAP